MKYQLKSFFDDKTFTLSYLVYDKHSKDALIIDPVLNYDYPSSVISFDSLNKVLNFIRDEDLNLHYVLETHVHADHLTAAAEIKKKKPQIKVAISQPITEVQSLFKEIYNFKNFLTDGSQFDLLLSDGQTLKAGSLEVTTILTPGHTPACASFLIGDNLFTGDALFMPDSGTGRCDFPAGSASKLYHSIQHKLYSLPPETKTFTGHDYQPNGRELRYQSTIAEQKQTNIQLKGDTTENEFIAFRESRDATLSAPKLLFPSIQINMNAGNMPKAEENGKAYLKIPLS